MKVDMTLTHIWDSGEVKFEIIQMISNNCGANVSLQRFEIFICLPDQLLSTDKSSWSLISSIPHSA